MEDLTDPQLKFIFHAYNEREKMKKENAESQQNKQQLKNNF
jgi:hypothetical protein